MKKLLLTIVPVMMLFGVSIAGQQEETYDYWQNQRQMVRQGQQAVFMCNGLFTSNRTLEQVFQQELAFLPDPIGTAQGGDYEVDYERKGVVIGKGAAKRGEPSGLSGLHQAHDPGHNTGQKANSDQSIDDTSPLLAGLDRGLA